MHRDPTEEKAKLPIVRQQHKKERFEGRTDHPCQMAATSKRMEIDRFLSASQTLDRAVSHSLTRELMCQIPIRDSDNMLDP